MPWRLAVHIAGARSSVTVWKWAMASSTVVHIAQANMALLNWKTAWKREQNKKSGWTIVQPDVIL
jgi:hypothetical protein